MSAFGTVLRKGRYLFLWAGSVSLGTRSDCQVFAVAAALRALSLISCSLEAQGVGVVELLSAKGGGSGSGALCVFLLRLSEPRLYGILSLGLEPE